MNKGKRFLSCILVGLAGLCIWGVVARMAVRWAVYELTAPPIRKALPFTAQDVHDWSWEEGGETGQDYCYMVKAKITPEEFRQYINRFGLTLHTPTRRYSMDYSPGWNGCTFIEKPDWWTPSDDMSGTYVHDYGSAWVYAKYEGGYIFVVSYNLW